MIFFHQWLNKYTNYWQFMIIHELWNLIIFLNFKTSLVIILNIISRNFKKSKENTPAYPNAPLTKTSYKIVVLALKQKWLEYDQLKKDLDKMKTELGKNSIEIDYSLHNDLTKIIKNYTCMTPLVNLFWQQQQQKSFFSVFIERWNVSSYVNRICISLQQKSTSPDEELRNLSILRLPSSRYLRNIRITLDPTQPSFRRDIIVDVIELTEKYVETQKYIGILIEKNEN